MPIYEFKCSKCGHLFETLVRTFNGRPDACPKCGAKDLDKQFSSFSASVAHEHGSMPSCAATGSCPSAGLCSGGTCPFN